MSLMPRTLAQHLDPSVLPKRILSLDGGGVRGILSLQYLKAIEGLLRKQYGDPTLVLSDYFDLIGGTSTGAIIAGGLALGMDTEKLEGLYTALATKIFKKPFFRIGAFVPKFGNASLQKALQDAYLVDTTLGAPNLKTGLMVMTKRMDSGSPWPITNQPLDPYYLPKPGKKRVGHANMLLWQIVRASTAAPHYFRPEDIVVGRWLDPSTGKEVVEHGQFVDGGITTANNPSLQLLKVALLGGFKFGWKSGEDNLLMVSVGTGLRKRGRGRATGWRATAGAFAASAVLSIMDDCNNQVETVMQWLSCSPNARRIDGQIETLSGDLLAGAPLLRYLRYNVTLDADWTKKDLQLSFDQPTLDRLSEMDKPANMSALADLGRKAAAIQVKSEHFQSEAMV
jgi:uncharacterized protein